MGRAGLADDLVAAPLDQLHETSVREPFVIGHRIRTPAPPLSHGDKQQELYGSISGS